MSTTQIDLIRQTEAARALIYACRDDLDGDEQATADMVEGSTDLMEAIDGALDRLCQIDNMAVAITNRVNDLRDRNDRLLQQSDRIRNHIWAAMQVMNVRRVERPVATLSIRNTPVSLNVTDETLIPDQYLIPQPAKPDKKAMLAALKEGAEIPGAALNPAGTTLAISTR